MKTFWENNGEANADGDFIAVIDMEDGSGIQRFTAKSHKDLADKLLNSQANATKKIRELSAQSNEDASAALAVTETKEFLKANPDFYACPANNTALMNYMRTFRMEPTRQNFATAFENLKTSGLLVAKPSTETNNEPENNGGLPNNGARPRGASSTGLRNGDSSAGQRRAGATAQKYTREDIESMPAKVYTEKLTGEPGFAQLVDKLFEKPKAAAR